MSTTALTTIIRVKNNFSATTDPGATDDFSENYAVGSHWQNTTDGTLFICKDNTTDAAIWDEILTDVPIGTLVSQNSHGFVVGDIIFFNGSTYAKAKADVSTTLGFLMVNEVLTANAILVLTTGYVQGLSSLTAGEYHYLSDQTAGALTATEPTISVLLFFADSTTTGFLLPYRPTIAGTESTRLETQSTKTMDYTIVNSDYIIFADSTSTGVDITLPAAGTVTGRTFIIKAINIDNTTTIQTNGAETIDGASSITFAVQFESYILVSDGSNWNIY